MTSNSIVSRIFDPQQANPPRPRFSLVRRVPLVRPNLQALYQGATALPRFVEECPVAMRYLRLLGPLSWSRFPERDLRTNWGAPTMPYVPFVAACLVKFDQHLPYMSHLRQYLVEHPALTWVLGFPLVASSRYPWGFDVDASRPTQRHLARLLRHRPTLRGEAELTQPFDCSDVSYFFPLMAETERRLGFKPPLGALDAAYDGRAHELKSR